MKRKSAKQLFANSLLELSMEKDVDKIRIKEIADNCGLSCQTFYNHFSDKQELVLWIHKSVGDELLNRLIKGEISFHELLIENLKFYLEHSDFMLNVLRNIQGEHSYASQSSENAINILGDYIKKKNHMKELPEDLAIYLRMYIYSNTGIYAYWADKKSELTLEQMAGFLEGAIPTPLKKYFI